MKRLEVSGDPSQEVISTVAEILISGGVVLLPTDTIYGLHAVASDRRAVERITVLKGREESKPFVVIAASIQQLRDFGATVPDNLRSIWPAPLTAILRRGETTVAARIPDASWLRDLLLRTGPLVSTSANRSGEPPVHTPEHLEDSLQKSLDAIVDAGWQQGKASTIVDFTSDQPRLVREGDSDFTQKLRKTLRISL